MLACLRPPVGALDGMRSNPRYGRSTAGIVTLPSACWAVLEHGHDPAAGGHRGAVQHVHELVLGLLGILAALHPVAAYLPKKDDAENDAKEIYEERAATAETVYADLRRWRGLQQIEEA